MRILGLDYGEVRIGLAISDPDGVISQPLGHFGATPRRELLDHVRRLCVERQVGRLVVGLPVNMNGTEAASAEKARQFGEAAAAATGLPVEFVDERLTTASAERLLIEADMGRRQRKGKIDSVAAALILQTYLDRAAFRAAADAENGNHPT